MGNILSISPMPLTARQSARTTRSATSGPTTLRRGTNTGDTASYTQTAGEPPTMSAMTQGLTSVHHSHLTRTSSIHYYRAKNHDQDLQDQNATVCLAVTLLILTSVTMVPVAVMIISPLATSVMTVTCMR